jgi:hypothetical protein
MMTRFSLFYQTQDTTISKVGLLFEKRDGNSQFPSRLAKSSLTFSNSGQLWKKPDGNPKSGTEIVNFRPAF